MMPTRNVALTLMLWTMGALTACTSGPGGDDAFSTNVVDAAATDPCVTAGGECIDTSHGNLNTACPVSWQNADSLAGCVGTSATAVHCCIPPAGGSHGTLCASHAGAQCADGIHCPADTTVSATSNDCPDAPDQVCCVPNH